MADTQHVHTVATPGSGQLTISLKVDLFRLTGPERELLFALVDKLKAFADANKTDKKEGA